MSQSPDIAVADPDNRRLIPFDEITDEVIGPRGTPEREAHEERVAAIRRRWDRIERLTGWMYRIPPRWVTYRDPDVDYTEHFGVGPVAYVFWSSLLEGGFYNALDALSFKFFDDAYVPTLSQWRDRKSLQRNWRRRQAAMRGEAVAIVEDLREQGLLSDDSTKG